MTIVPKSKTFGAGRVVGMFNALSSDMQTTTLKEGVRSACEPVKRYAKMLAPRETGALEKSIGFSMRRARKSASAYAVVGPMNGNYDNGKKSKARTANSVNPAKYAHLVEYGHVKVAPKKGANMRNRKATTTGFVSPRPFMRPATTMAGPESRAKFAAVIAAAQQKRLASG